MATKKEDWVGHALMAIPVFIIALVLSMAFARINAAFANSVWAQVGITAVVLVGSVFALSKANFDDLTFARGIIYLSILGLYGTIVTLLVPSWTASISPFVLTLTGDFTVLGLLFTGFYIMFGQTIAGWLK